MQPLPPHPARRAVHAFSLIELLVVITIIALLATLALPAIKGFGKSNAITSADRQLLDDLANARQIAIAQHTTVYILFASPAIGHANTNVDYPSLTESQKEQVYNAARGQYTSYILYSEHTVGDQPGQKTKRYLSRWKTLPDGLFIATDKFRLSLSAGNDGIFPFEVRSFPFPTVTNKEIASIPCIAFNHLGQLIGTNGQVVSRNPEGYEVIPLARGSILYPDPANPFTADVLETPAGNSLKTKTTWHHIRIDGITGRARVEQFEIPQLQ